MSAPPLAAASVPDDTADAGSLAQMEDERQAAEDEGVMETCISTEFAWYADAERDVQRYLDSLEKELASKEEATEVGEKSPQHAEDDFAELGQNRSASYNGWEDEELAEWMPEKLLKRSNRKGVKYYLVKWWHHDTPTWESSEDLEEEGHFVLMAKFDAAKAAESQNSAKPGKRRLRSTQFDPTAFWPDFQTRICAAFADTGRSVTEIHNVLTASVGSAFMAHWRGDTDFVPAMLFHGTRLESILSIAKNGFYIPGTGGVRVVNGSAHGVGIYTATTPSISYGYARGDYMFVCAGLIGGKYWTTTKNAGNVCVFFERNRVVPCFLVKFGFPASEAKPAYFPTFDPVPFRSCQSTSSMNCSGYDGDARTIASGGQQPGMSYSKTCRTLTKKQLRAAPRVAKDAYKAGLLLQYKS